MVSQHNNYLQGHQERGPARGNQCPLLDNDYRFRNYGPLNEPGLPSTVSGPEQLNILSNDHQHQILEKNWGSSADITLKDSTS